MKKSKKEHYVNNVEFLNALQEYKNEVAEANALGKDAPPITEYIGKCFLDIATGLSFRPNFINYTYKDEMISDGIENCWQYCHNFDPEKSKNPFSYFTQIIYYAFIRRIEREKKQSYIKHKLTYESGILDELLKLDPSDTKINIDIQKNDYFDIQGFEDKMEKKRKARRVKSKTNLEIFMEQ